MIYRDIFILSKDDQAEFRMVDCIKNGYLYYFETFTHYRLKNKNVLKYSSLEIEII